MRCSRTYGKTVKAPVWKDEGRRIKGKNPRMFKEKQNVHAPKKAIHPPQSPIHLSLDAKQLAGWRVMIQYEEGVVLRRREPMVAWIERAREEQGRGERARRLKGEGGV
jgi:hypothetical protein